MGLASPGAAKGPGILVTAPAEIAIRHVNYADLNLASQTDQRALFRRVGAAVIGLCDETTDGDHTETWFRVPYTHCTDVAWKQAIPQITRAVQRAKEIAATGKSSIAAVALTITGPE